MVTVAAAALIVGQGVALFLRHWRRIAMSKGLIQPETRPIGGARRVDTVTDASRDSFPASDPPAFAHP